MKSILCAVCLALLVGCQSTQPVVYRPDMPDLKNQDNRPILRFSPPLTRNHPAATQPQDTLSQGR